MPHGFPGAGATHTKYHFCVQNIHSAWGSCPGTGAAERTRPILLVGDQDPAFQSLPLVQLVHGIMPLQRLGAAGPPLLLPRGCFAEARLAQTAQHPIPGLSSASHSHAA